MSTTFYPSCLLLPGQSGEAPNDAVERPYYLKIHCGRKSPMSCWVNKAHWEALLALTAATGALHGGRSLFLRTVSCCWSILFPYLLNGSPRKPRQIFTFSFYILALMAPEYLGALVCKDLCDCLSVTHTISNCITWELLPGIQYQEEKCLNPFKCPFHKNIPMKKRINLLWIWQLSTF